MALISLPNITFAIFFLLLIRRIHWEATTGARRRALCRQHGCLPPKVSRTKDPIFGSDVIWRNLKSFHHHLLLEDWGKLLTKNNTHTVQSISATLLLPRTILTDDPENVKSLLSTNFDAWSLGSDRIARMSAYLGDGVFTTDGAAWKHSRDLLRPGFERSRVADVSILEKHMKHYMDLLPKDGTTVDLHPLMKQYSLDVTTEFLFGKSTNALLDRGDGDHGATREFMHALEYCLNPLCDEGQKRLGVLALALPDWKFERCCGIIREFADKLIAEHMAHKSDKPIQESSSRDYVFLDELLAVTNNHNTIRSELLNILAAGADTTSCLLSNLIYEIPRHPSVVTRLRLEIADHVGTDKDIVPTYQQMKEMKYLRAVINECQRLYPVVPSNSREAIRDTTIPRGGGPDGTAPVFIEKGTYVAYHTWSMHHRPDIYGADALDFNPSRWLADEREGPPLRPGWAYIPFSGGPRLCVGQNFAMSEAMFLVVRFLQCFEIGVRDEGPWREKLAVTCSNRDGCRVALWPRA